MIRYYKLFDMLNRKSMKKTDLLEIISPSTLAKFSKGEVVKTDIIDKICIFLHCQPGDIMECITNIEEYEDESKIIEKPVLIDECETNIPILIYDAIDTDIIGKPREDTYDKEYDEKMKKFLKQEDK